MQRTLASLELNFINATYTCMNTLTRATIILISNCDYDNTNRQTSGGGSGTGSSNNVDEQKQQDTETNNDSVPSGSGSGNIVDEQKQQDTETDDQLIQHMKKMIHLQRTQVEAIMELVFADIRSRMIELTIDVKTYKTLLSWFQEIDDEFDSSDSEDTKQLWFLIRINLKILKEFCDYDIAFDFYEKVMELWAFQQQNKKKDI